MFVHGLEFPYVMSMKMWVCECKYEDASLRIDSIRSDSMRSDSMKIASMRIDSMRTDSMRIISMKINSINNIRPLKSYFQYETLQDFLA